MYLTVNLVVVLFSLVDLLHSKELKYFGDNCARSPSFATNKDRTTCARDDGHKGINDVCCKVFIDGQDKPVDGFCEQRNVGDEIGGVGACRECKREGVNCQDLRPTPTGSSKRNYYDCCPGPDKKFGLTCKNNVCERCLKNGEKCKQKSDCCSYYCGTYPPNGTIKYCKVG